jgi:CheY-like chemotaxis protein
MKILVIDDNQSITNVISKFLKMKGHDCVTENEGRSGLARCLSQSFDAILLDLSMPEFSGKEFIDTLVKQGKIKDHRIIVFTSLPLGMINIEKSANRGIVQVLQKPVELDLLLKTLEETCMTVK